jgi:hypothetical protein
LWWAKNKKNLDLFVFDMSQKLNIRRFPIDRMKSHRVILLIGKRGTGKSTLLKDILYHIRQRIDVGFAMSPTHDTCKMFEDCLPRACIYHEYSLPAVHNLLASLNSLVDQNKHRDCGLFLDDCMYDKSIMKSNEMRQIHMNGRHLNMWFINSVQYLMDIGPELRSQIDYVFVLREPIRSNREKLHKYFFGIFDKYEEFSLVLDKTTENHECLVLDNTQVTNNIEDTVFYYKANPNIGKFRLGKPIYFKLDHHFHRKEKLTHGKQKTKLPDAVVCKKKIQQVEKSDEKSQHGK